MGLVKVEGSKNVEGKNEEPSLNNERISGMTLTQAAAVLAREDHLRLLLQFG